VSIGIEIGLAKHGDLLGGTKLASLDRTRVYQPQDRGRASVGEFITSPHRAAAREFDPVDSKVLAKAQILRKLQRQFVKVFSFPKKALKTEQLFSWATSSWRIRASKLILLDSRSSFG